MPQPIIKEFILYTLPSTCFTLLILNKFQPRVTSIGAGCTCDGIVDLGILVLTTKVRGHRIFLRCQIESVIKLFKV